jgi:membrane fusion protein (multidrug efflux system)
MMIRRSAAPWIGLAALAVLCLGLAGCKDKQLQATVPPPKPSVDVITLHARPVTLSTELPGRTSPYRTAEVRPQVYGIILKRLFIEGDTVQAGQQLYQIDPAPYEANLASAPRSAGSWRRPIGR